MYASVLAPWYAVDGHMLIPPLSPTRVNFQIFWSGGRPIWCGYIMVEPQTPLGVLHKSISYIYKVFLHLDKLWMGIWHQPQPDTSLILWSIFRNFGVGTDLSDVVTSWLSLKPHLELFTNPYHIYIKCFCTLLSCEWVYGTTLRPDTHWV